MSGQTNAPFQTSQTLTQGLARHLARKVSAGDKLRAQLHLLDWVGCAVAGRVEPAGRILLSQLDSRHRPCNFAELLPRLREA